jgi:hypothetical protein
LAGDERSLSEYAREHPAQHRGRCWTCGLPVDVLAQVDEARRESTATLAQTERWLLDLGHAGATKNKLTYHFQRRHHLGPEG